MVLSDQGGGGVKVVLSDWGVKVALSDQGFYVRVVYILFFQSQQNLNATNNSVILQYSV